MKNLLILLTFLLLFSCTKKNEKLIVGLWKVEKLELSIDGSNFMEEPLDCFEDDIWQFSKKGEFNINNGIICGGSQSSKGTWRILEDEKTIAFTYDGAIGEYYSIIEELDKNKLVKIQDNGTIPATFYKFHYTKY